MKKFYFSTIFAAFALGANAQKMIVHTTTGDVEFPIANVTSVTFDEEGGGEVNPDPDPVLTDAEAVDLGLPSGTLWASCNVGAKTPADYGDYFAYGETKPKSSYTKKNYSWYINYDSTCGNNPKLEYETVTYDLGGGETTTLLVLKQENDAASVNMGAEWRMPNSMQASELLEECTWQYAAYGDVRGLLVTGPNGNCLFFPMAGRKDMSDEGEYAVGTNGYYWTNTSDEHDQYSYYIGMTPTPYETVETTMRYYGRTIRAVKAQ